jgi:hypothetical protein
LWGFDRRADAGIRNAPAEIFRTCGAAEFQAEYLELCRWIRSFASLPDGGGFFVLTGVCMAPCDASGALTQSAFRCDNPKLDARGCFGQFADQLRCRPRVGLIVEYKGALVKILEIHRRVDMTKVYMQVMTTVLPEIRARKIWFAVRVFHRVTHMSVTTEALAEHAGSILRYMERKSQSQVQIGKFIWAARLRMAGLQGLGGEDAVLAAALNVHFGCSDPQGWHFERAHRRLLNKELC